MTRWIVVCLIAIAGSAACGSDPEVFDLDSGSAGAGGAAGAAGAAGADAGSD